MNLQVSKNGFERRARVSGGGVAISQAWQTGAGHSHRTGGHPRTVDVEWPGRAERGNTTSKSFSEKATTYSTKSYRIEKLGNRYEKTSAAKHKAKRSLTER